MSNILPMSEYYSECGYYSLATGSQNCLLPRNGKHRRDLLKNDPLGSGLVQKGYAIYFVFDGKVHGYLDN